MLITNLEKTAKFRPEMAGAEGVWKQIPIGSKEGSPHFTFRVFTIEPGGHTPLHSHPFEHINYIISGQGAVTDGKKERPVRQGDFALILPGETHQYRNLGETALVMICAVPKEYE